MHTGCIQTEQIVIQRSEYQENDIVKKKYITPEAEKIEFNYREQIVAASAGEGTPNIGDFYGDESWDTDGCKFYGAEAMAVGFCSYFSLR